MSERLAKLVQYLDNGNYEMAIEAYSRDGAEQMDHRYLIELARAFYVSEDYKSAIQLCQKCLEDHNRSILYEALIIIIKAKYLIKMQPQPQMRQLKQLVEQRVMNYRVFEKHHQDIVMQLERAFNQCENYPMLKMDKNQIQEFGRQFNRAYRQQQTSYLEQCIPMFVVSAKWFEQLEKFIGNRYDCQEEDCPGPACNFEILDHRFNLFWDFNPSKMYTNRIVFPTARVKVLNRQCWDLLRQSFYGIEVKRFNVWVMGKPREVITELYLKRLYIQDQDRRVRLVQISKKQNWAGVKKKFALSPQKYQVIDKNQTPYSQNLSLEQVETGKKLFRFKLKTTNSNNSKPKVACQYKQCRNEYNLKFCQCKAVKYCDSKCQQYDRNNHKALCELSYSHLKMKASILENFNLAERPFGGSKGLVGLRNLGNTCYMNSGLQCLSNTKELTQYFMSNQFLKQINTANPLGTKGHLSCAYAELIREMWTGNQNSVSPFTFKKVIGKFAAQFSGYGQQDSQEFISYLIDGLQQDLNLVKVKQNFETTDELIPDRQASLKSEINFSKRIQSRIRDLMVGQFKSTVVCQTCKRVSVCFDPYMLVSLPIPALAQHSVYFIPYAMSKGVMKVVVTVDNNTKLGDLRLKLEKMYLKGQGEQILIFNVVNFRTAQIVEENIPDQDKVAQIFDRISQSSSKDCAFMAYEVMQTQPNEARFRVDFEYKKEKKSLPRFINLTKQPTIPEISKNIEPSITRVSRNKPFKQAVQQIQMTKNNSILVHLKGSYDFLFYTSQKKTLSLQAEQKAKTLDDCLLNFTHIQRLEDNNKWYCNKCKEFVNATKQMQIYKSNKILVLAFKRFNRGFKVRDFVDYPIEGLNMGPYIRSNDGKAQILYDLYGVVNHFGTLSGGHYTASCKNFLDNQWYEFDDSRVTRIKTNSVVNDNAYVLFYRRRQ